MDKYAAEKEMLTSGYEDATGLWEMVWYMHGVAPEMSDEQVINLLRSSLGKLLHAGKVTLLLREPQSDREEQLNEDAACEVIDKDSSWAPPTLETAEFRFVNTEKGDAALHKIWAEASA